MRVGRNFKHNFQHPINDRFVLCVKNTDKTKVVKFSFPKKYRLETWSVDYDLEFSENGSVPVSRSTDQILYDQNLPDVEYDSWFCVNRTQYVIYLSFPAFCCFEKGLQMHFFKLDRADIEENDGPDNSFSFLLNYRFIINEHGTFEAVGFDENHGCFEIYVEYSAPENVVRIKNDLCSFKLYAASLASFDDYA
jgi:hypothetical protein